MTQAMTSDRRSDARAAIVAAAARLLHQDGASAVTTRRVAEAAGIQAPTIYRLFGDKDGLLDAVAEHVLATFVSTKVAAAHAASTGDVDPVEDLRAGWDLQIAFGVANPALFALLSDPTRGADSPAVLAGRRVLEARVRRVAAAGRLRVGEGRAVDLIHAAGTGTVLATLSAPPDQRDPGLADAMFEAVLRQILTAPPRGPATGDHLDDVRRTAQGKTVAAVALRSVAPELDMLSAAERLLLADWLDRAIGALQDP